MHRRSLLQGLGVAGASAVAFTGSSEASEPTADRDVRELAVPFHSYISSEIADEVRDQLMEYDALLIQSISGGIDGVRTEHTVPRTPDLLRAVASAVAEYHTGAPDDPDSIIVKDVDIAVPGVGTVTIEVTDE